MTYILGINNLNINALICDTRVTWYQGQKRVRGENISQKTGLFFPGCLFGISGSMNHATSFIIECKQFLTGTNTLEGSWQKFLDFISTYRFSTNKDDYFELLLSSRNFGKPTFFHLNSRGIVELTDNMVSIGSGKQILDNYIKDMFSTRSDSLRELIDNQNLPPITFAYFYCLWLNEMAQGLDLPTLEKHNVGGIFHFRWQDTSGEHTQLPAVYVISAADPEKKLILSWIYRIAYAEDALTFWDPIKNTKEIFVSSAARPNLEVMHLKQLKNDIISIVDSQPFYYFCGFGFSDPANRGEFGAAITTNNEFDVDKNGSISPRIRALIQGKFSRDYKFSQ